MRQAFEKQFFWAQDVNVTNGEPNDPTEVRFDVETQGSTIHDTPRLASRTDFPLFLEDALLGGARLPAGSTGSKTACSTAPGPGPAS